MGNRDTAVSLLNQIVESTLDSEWEFENKRDRLLAQLLLDQLSTTS